MNKNTPLLDTIHCPDNLKQLNDEQLKNLCDELRQEVIEKVSKTGGHLGAGLGVVELTVALQSVFNTPEDKIVWDVGHQTYPHKILTGRRERMNTMRMEGGLSGFTKRSESKYDPFGAGHSSTSISAALGMAVARDMRNEDNEVVAVIGDGAMSAGMAYEAMNNAGSIDTRLIVILNDNNMSIAPPVGAMSGYLSRLISSKPYIQIRRFAKKTLEYMPEMLSDLAKRANKSAKTMATGGNIFEEMGFYYIGPIDGHNLEHLLPILRNVKDTPRNRPILIHVVTEKGHGFDSPETSSEKYHAVKKFDVVTKIQEKNKSTAPSYTSVFSDRLIQDAESDDKVIAITAAMPSGTGLDKFQDRFPERTFDVGIAEQHAVTFAAGLAAEGYKPFVAIYSTFLQRAYDQIVHDVAIQNLPVRFAIDRAGLVGSDGATHAGSFDISYLCSLPNMVVMAASDEAELYHMVHTAVNYSNGPIAFRYPRGEGLGLEIPETPKKLEIGKGRIIKSGNKIAILSLGARLQECLEAAKILESKGLSTTVADARFAKPLDIDLIKQLAITHDVLITIEEGAIGGFGAHVLNYLETEELLNVIKTKTIFLPDEFAEHGNQEKMYKEAGLDKNGIVSSALLCLNDRKPLKINNK